MVEVLGLTFKDHFSPLAAHYAAFRPRYGDALFDYLAGLAPTRQLVWDCACGSGQATISLAERFERVIATDPSAEQIAAAPAHPRVSYRVAPAEQSGIDAASVDLVTVAQALHWFDVQRFYAEVERVLRGGGVLAAWTYSVVDVDDPKIQRQVREFYEMLDPWWPPERALVESGYRTLPFPFEEIAAPQFTMQERWSLDQLLGYLRSWSAVGRFIGDRGEDPVEALRGRIEPAWGNPSRERLVTWPLTVRVSRR